MNRLAAMLAIALVAGCSGAPDADESKPDVSAPDVSAPAMSAPDAASGQAATTASATGTVEAVDVDARKITIAHGPVEALDWPAMTMNFDATPDQVESVQVGQAVRFEFTSTGMDGTIVSIEPRE